MIVADDIEKARAIRLRDTERSWGFVPTMGYLHEGHLSLVRRSVEENERTAVSIFVNPTQFAPDEDFERYPRDLDRDLVMLKKEGVDLVFTPQAKSIYTEDFQTTVKVQEVSKPLEGRSRPTHFEGVATIVAKLFNIIEPTRAYFGQKDAQQSIVIRQMVRDLNFNLEIVVCPTVREFDGLAMSSRNVRLSQEERAAAPIIFRTLQLTAQMIEAGERDADRLRAFMQESIAIETMARVDYVSLADADTLRELSHLGGTVLISTAVFLGKIRLIDNVIIDVDTA